MQIVLLVAGIVSIYPIKQTSTGVLLIALTSLNAGMGLSQEGKAAKAIAALQQMMLVKAKVLHDGQLAEIPADQLVSSCSPSTRTASTRRAPTAS